MAYIAACGSDKRHYQPVYRSAIVTPSKSDQLKRLRPQGNAGAFQWHLIEGGTAHHESQETG